MIDDLIKELNAFVNKDISFKGAIEGYTHSLSIIEKLDFENKFDERDVIINQLISEINNSRDPNLKNILDRICQELSLLQNNSNLLTKIPNETPVMSFS